MGETNRNVWAPWRMEYIESIAGRDSADCFLCADSRTPENDRRNLVLRRSQHTLTVLNRFPYSSGHLLIAPTAHESQLSALPESVLTEIMLRLRDAQRVLEVALKPQGFNIGMNVGRCAGAGLPDHLHWHVVPRWNGDTNFMPVLGDVKVMPEALERTYDKLLKTAQELGL